MPLDIAVGLLVAGDGRQPLAVSRPMLRQAHLSRDGDVSIRIGIAGDGAARLTIKPAAPGRGRRQYE